MSLSSLVTSALLSVLLCQLPPDPFGPPPGAKPGSDQTGADGVRTIEYEHNGNHVEVEIQLDGSTTETTTDANKHKTTREYKTHFDHSNGTRTEVLDEGAGRTQRRTFDATGHLTKRESIDDDPIEGDATSFRRTIRETTYDPLTGQTTSVTTAEEEHGLLPTGESALKRRRARIETFDPDGRRTGLTHEEVDLVEHEEGVGGVYRGTRKIQTRNAQDEIVKTGEVMDPNTQLWVPESAVAPPEPESEPEAEPEAGPEESISEGPARRAGYVALSPGILHIALPDAVGYQWGLRGGVELSCGGACSIAAGASFQHSVVGSATHLLRTQAELIPGARLLDDRLFVFGVVGIGHVANVLIFERVSGTERFTQHGVAISPGIGVSYVAWRELFVGGRFGADLQWFPAPIGTFAAYTLALDLFAGWRFGF